MYVNAYGCSNSIGGIFKSTDGGVTWITLAAGAEVGACQDGPLVIDPNHPETLFLVRNDSFDDVFGLVQSTDGGTTWSTIWSPGTSVLTAFAIDPENSAYLYAALEGLSTGDLAGLFKSSDGGATWNPIGSPKGTFTALVVDPFNSMTLYAAESQTVLKSLDGGATWSDASVGLQSITSKGSVITSLAADRGHAGVLYLGSSGAGTFRTVNGGESWTGAGAATTGVNVRQLSVVSGSLYAATTDGVFKLTNF